MVGDWWTWLNSPANSAAIAAVSAAASGLLTIGLVVFAGVQSVLMRGQRAEMIQARKAEIQPWIHVTQARAIRGSMPDFTLVIGTSLVNVGKGPALGVQAELAHPQIQILKYGYVHKPFLDRRPPTLEESAGPSLLEAGGKAVEIAFRADSSFQSEPTEIGILKVVYRDLLDRWWQTKVALQFDLVKGTGSFLQIEVVLLDQTEAVTEIPHRGIPLKSY